MNSILWIKKVLNNRFEMKDLGETRMIFGMDVVHDRKHRKLFITQDRCSKRVLERFGMEMVRPTNTPIQDVLDSEKRLDVKANEFCDLSVPYCEPVGFLMYLMIGTRPDIVFAGGKLSKFCERSKNRHWIAVKNTWCGS